MVNWLFEVDNLQAQKNCVLYETKFHKGDLIKVAFAKGIREKGIGKGGPWSAGKGGPWAEEGYTSRFIQDYAFYVKDLQTGHDLFP